MQYKVGEKLITKKPHACGGNEWSVQRVGADVKLKCSKCGKTVFFEQDKIQKMTKKRIGGFENE